MFANVEALHHALLEKEPRNFVSHHIFEPVPFAFQNNLEAWIGWKRILADSLDVDPQDIVLTGSAAVGYSLNPFKDFKAFNDKSDIDCGIISGYYFDVAWRYLRQQQVYWLSLPPETKGAIRDHRTNHIFGGTIATDKMIGILPFGNVWQKALNEMSKVDPTKDRDVKLRIYKDYDALRHYQARGIERLRNMITESEASDEGDEHIVGDAQ